MTDSTSAPATLSILDFSKRVAPDRDARDCIADTVRLAKDAERLGFHRFWVAEHHMPKESAHASPTTMISYLAGATHRLRLGTGALLLTYYSPFQVAESFRLLNHLSGDRIDLGIGRAAGVVDDRQGRAISSALLNGMTSQLQPDVWEQKVRDLVAFCGGPLPRNHMYADAEIIPPNVPSPTPWLLGSGSQSAALAASLGVNFAAALFLNGAPPGGHEIIEKKYLAKFRATSFSPTPRVLVGVSALCAPSEAEARAKNEEIRVAGAMPAQFVGTTSQVCAQIRNIMRDYHSREAMVLTICDDYDFRLRSYELIRDEFAKQPLELPALRHAD